MTKISDIELFLLDMDGTIYLGNDLFDGSLDFINKLILQNKKYIFLTNNSAKSKIDYIKKLSNMNIPCTIDSIFSSGTATGIYLKEHYPNKRVYLLGTKSLKEELENHGVTLVEDNPDIVLVGFDTELNYQKLEKACQFLCDGAIFLATHCDLVCPIENKRYIPDCGSICNMLTVATEKKPKYIGKPDPLMIDIIANKLNIPKSKIAMVGDRMYTDIACGYNAKVTTICVLSGESTMDTINNSDIKPDYIFDSIKDIIKLL